MCASCRSLFIPSLARRTARLLVFACATRSTAPDVGIDLATALMPPWAAKKGMQSAWAARIAKESLGVTKNWVPVWKSTSMAWNLDAIDQTRRWRRVDAVRHRRDA